MRVTRRVQRDDRGAVLIVVALFTVVAVFFLAFVIDIGDQRQNRRQLTTETDAVALGVAKDWVLTSMSSSFTCADAASYDRLSVYNNPVKNPTADPACSFVSPNPFQGYVTVTDGEIAEFEFGGVTGVDEGATGSASTVAISVIPGGGLRPLALCLLDVDLASWIATGSPSMFDIFAEKFLNPLCVDSSSAPGNWGQVVLPPSGANLNDWRDDVENGTEEDVTVNQSLENFTGAGMNGAAAEFEALEGTIFFLPVYSQAVTSNGHGSDVEYPVTGFIEIRLISSDVSGSDPSFVIEPLRFQDSGTCCFVNESNAALAICDVGSLGGSPSSDVVANCLDSLPPAVTTTTQPDRCAVASVSPMTQTASVSGPPDPRLTTEVVYTFDVVDPSDCVGPEVAAVGPGPDPAAAVTGPSGSTYTVKFEFGSPGFQKGKSYKIEISDDGAFVDDRAILEISS